MTFCFNPPRDCDRCPRLAGFRSDNIEKFPDKFNAPVPAFGVADPALLVVGLAPGLKGANFTGRPFTGDYAGDLLYPTLKKFSFAKGNYDRRADDGFTLTDTRITNAVRCVPPGNKPTAEEMRTCLSFLEQELAELAQVQIILALGTIAHNSVLRALGLKLSAYKFGHGVQHHLRPEKNISYPVILLDSYHCSRYNVNTRRLTTQMFEDVVQTAREKIPASKAA